MNKETEREFDVLVIGGGPAGIAASIAAARSGAKTALIEQDPSPGGNVHHSNVHTICGLFRNNTDRPEPVHRGFPIRFAGELVRRGGADHPKQVGKVRVLPIFPDAFCDLARKWLEKERLLAMNLNMRLQKVDRIRNGWNVRTKSTKKDLEANWYAKLLLDTSGDAIAVRKADAACLQAPLGDLQIPSYIVELSGIPEPYLEGFKKFQVHHHLAEGVKDGVLPEGCESVLLRPGPDHGTGYLTLNMPRCSSEKFDPFDESNVRTFEQNARQRAEQITSLLRKKNDEFQDLRIVRFPERIGIRETCRMKGRQIVDRDHVLNGISSATGVARSAWPIELWDEYETPEFQLPESPCDIPLGCLVSETYPNLGSAGRCMSATHDALGSLRVIGTAMATGEALGFAAAMSTSNRDLSAANPELIYHEKQDVFDSTHEDVF